MGNYIVSARKYRPGTFASVVGQAHVTRTLRSAILMDQLAHAFLFSGPRGVGKTTCARILAKAINCEDLQENGEPCNVCASCKTYNQGKSINIHELDAASNNSVDDIRNLNEQTRYVPSNGKRSVYIIDEVHMLSQAAFNAFLKTLEEPPAHVLFILATTEKHKILPTILSRVQKFDFKRIRVDDIAKHLEYISKEENVDYEFAALQQIALKADGALRDALSLYDQLVSYTNSKVTFASVLENLNILDYDYYFRAVDYIRGQDHTQLLLLLNEIIEKGFEAKDFIVGLTEHFRNLLVCQVPQTVKLLETSENVKKRYLEQSQQLEGTFLLNAFQLSSEAEQKMRFASHPRLAIELTLVKLAHLATAIKVAAGHVPEPVTPEKKKPLVKEKPVKHEAPEKEVESVDLSPPPAPVVEHSSPLGNGSANHSGTVTRKRKRKNSGLKLTDSLSAMEAEIDRQKAENQQDEPQVEEIINYEVNYGINIDLDRFQQFVVAYCEVLKTHNKMNLVSAIQGGNTHLHHNKWVFSVENDIYKSLIESEKDLLPFLREKLNVAELFMEVKVDENFVNPRDAIPYTEEQKLQAMGKKNPTLQKLQEIFKTRIIYR